MSITNATAPIASVTDETTVASDPTSSEQSLDQPGARNSFTKKKVDDFTLDFRTGPHFSAKRTLSSGKGGDTVTQKFTFSKIADGSASGVLVTDFNKCSEAFNDQGSLNTCSRRNCNRFHAKLGDVVAFKKSMSGKATEILGRAHPDTLAKYSKDVTISDKTVDRHLNFAKQHDGDRKRKRQKVEQAAAMMKGEEKKEQAPTSVVDRTRWIAKFGRAGYAFQHGIAVPGELGPMSVTAARSAMGGEVGQELIDKSWSIISKFANEEGKVPCNSCGHRISNIEAHYCVSCFGFIFCATCFGNPDGNPHFHLCKPHPAWGALVD